MPDFLPTLIAGTILFVILLIAFSGFFPSSIPASSERHIVLGENFVILQNATSRNLINLKGAVSEGMLNERVDIVSFNAANPGDISQGTVRLFVNDTNLYGRLIFTINGKEVYRDYFPKGTHTFSFTRNPFKDTDNALRVSTEGSGWRIWAPTVYFYSMNLSADYLGVVSKNFTFNITEEEYEKMNASRLVISTRKIAGGNLIANLNREEVFRGSANAFQDLDLDLLHKGLNYLELKSDMNSRYEVSSAEIVLFFKK